MNRTGDAHPSILVAAGGTGGHIFPALAVMEVLSERYPDLKFTWLGSSHRMEARLIPAKGIDFIGLRQTEIRRRLSIGNIFYNLRSLWFLAVSIIQAIGIVRRLRPKFVLSTGGFVAGAAGLAAWMTRTPLIIVEPNAWPGLTNRFLGKRASMVFTAYPETKRFFPEDRTHIVGAPARREVAEKDRNSARSQLGLSDSTLFILAMGGSQGATKINQVLPDAAKLLTERNPEIILRIGHQCGQGKTERVVVDRNALPQSVYEVVEFIDDVPTYLAAADVIVSRAGASTLSEVGCRGLPSILIPYALSSENHQVTNARTWENAGASICIEEAELDASVLAEKLSSVLTDPNKRGSMGKAALTFGNPAAAGQIADQLVDYLKPGHVS